MLAIAFGAVIGIEREWSGKSAGLRTNVLICLGAAVFTIISMNLGGQESLTRIAAAVITGGGVHGLTTAATIWLVAGIGMACGGWFLSSCNSYNYYRYHQPIRPVKNLPPSREKIKIPRTLKKQVLNFFN